MSDADDLDSLYTWELHKLLGSSKQDKSTTDHPLYVLALPELKVNISHRHEDTLLHMVTQSNMLNCKHCLINDYLGV